MPAPKQPLGLDYALEKRLISQGYKAIAGVDEVGRGPLAGPVTAAAVIIKNPEPLLMVKDSKKLSPKKRAELYDVIFNYADVGIGHASVEEIDEINILQATFLAMTRALKNLPTQPDYALVDGNRLPKNMPCKGASIIKGDGHVLSIAAASVIAKVTRDKIMHNLALDHPHFGWETNAGYGAKKHMDALQEHGPTPHHRKSFAPVARLLE